MTRIPASGLLQGRAVEEWVGATPNSKPPAAVWDRLFLRQNGRCALSGRKIRPGDKTALDHKKRLKDGGDNRESNLQLVLVGEHAVKTAAENRQGAKERRTRMKHLGTWPPSRHKIRSRGFPKRTAIEADRDT